MDFKKYLYQRGMTIAGLARLVGVTRCTLSNILHKRVPPSPKVAIKIHNLTGGEINKKDLRPDIFD